MTFTKRQTWYFFLWATGLSTALFLGLTIDAHRNFPKLTHSDQLTPQVQSGMEVWHKYNCTNCHTLLGEGAYYAPDLTKISKQRGDAYLKTFLRDPGKFYRPEDYGRVMPTLGLSDQEIDDVVAFLGWVSNVDTNGWPPRPLLVAGSAIPGAAQTQAKPAASSSPVELGRALFNSTEAGCSGCHSLVPNVNLVGPNLSGIAERAAETIHKPEYKGSAKTAEEYIEESIKKPNAYVVPGPNYGAHGVSIMPQDFATRLTADAPKNLAAFLLSIK